MLFKQRFWPLLADGTVTVAFRRWRRPTVRAGGRLRVPSGILAIDTVSVVAPSDIAELDARRAGFTSRAELLRELDARADGDLYRIDFHYAGPDDRAALREQDTMSDDELEELRRRLMRLDAAGRHGPWTVALLRLIAERPPGTRATELAAGLGRDTPSLKRDVRKLKELGLTESLGTGYRVSPRGRALLDSLTPRRLVIP